jgi:Signal transduction histidine kinase
MKSLRLKISLVTLVFQFTMLALLIVSNRVFVEPYFVWQTHTAMRDAYERFIENPDKLKQLGADTGYKLSIADKTGSVIESSSPEYIGGTRLPLPREQLEFFLDRRDRLLAGQPVTNVIDSDLHGQSVIQLLAAIPGDRYLVITQPLKQVRLNTRLAEGFFLTAGTLLLVITILGTSFISWSFVKPVLELTDIAEHIAALDFTRKYREKRNDEIGRLGENMNQISEQLDRAFSGLKRANVELNEQIRMQQKFLASVSHEFKTPLGLIRGYAELLDKDIVCSAVERERSLGIILEETDRLSGLIDDIIELARLGSASFSVQKTSVILSGILGRLPERFAPALQRRELKLAVEVADATVISADEQRCAEVFDNLVSNAIRHAESGTTIGVTVHRTGGCIQVDVTNRGTGIAPEDLDRVFEPFWRNGEDRNRSSGGSGLGLSIVREIMRLHDGSCEIANYPGGVRATVKFPA